MLWLIRQLFIAALMSSGSYQAVTVSAAQELHETRVAPAPSLLCKPIICGSADSVHPDYDELVCGSNGVFYDSLCAFENAKCEDPGLDLAHTDSCASSITTHTKKKRKSCDLKCEDYWSPICGSDGVTYSNACRLEEAYCRDQSIGPVYYGECD